MQRIKRRQNLSFFLLFLLVIPLLLLGNTDNAYAVVPNAPTGLTATAVSGSQINLSWTASALNQVTATGGTVTTVGGIETHTFTTAGSNTFTVTSVGGNGTGIISVNLVAGGGGGGDGGGGSFGGGGGGGGGSGGSASNPSMPVTATSYTASVGAGGTVVGNGNDGGGSSFNGLSSGGGGGGLGGDCGCGGGGAGGTGGGAGSPNGNAGGTGGNGVGNGAGGSAGHGGGSVYDGHGGGGNGGVGNSGSGTSGSGGGTGEVKIAFENPIPAVSGYKIERSTDNLNWSTINANTGNTTTTYHDTGLTNGQIYYYRISGINADGTSSVSSTANATTFKVPPAPVLSKVNTLSSSSISVSWLNSTGARWFLVYQESPTGHGFSQIINTTSLSYINTNLINATQYNYEIFAGNSSGTSSTPSNTISNYTLTFKPTNLSLTVQSPSQINLSWTQPKGTFTGNFIEYSLDNSTWSTLVANTGNTTAHYNATSLSPNTKYYFRVSAINQGGTNGTTNMPLATTVPGVPTSLSASRLSQSSIHLGWIAPSGNGIITGYKIERSENGGISWSTIDANTGNSTTAYTDTGLTLGITYTYQVSAINSGGTSSPSGTSSATTSQDIVLTAHWNNGVTNLVGKVLQSNLTSQNNAFNLVNGIVTISGLTNKQNFTFVDNSTNFAVFKVYNFNATSTNSGTYSTNVFPIDCSSNGVGTDLEAEINETDGHRISSVTTPVCSSANTLTTNATYSANGKSNNSFSSEFAVILTSANFQSNPSAFSANGTNVGTSYGTNTHIATSSPFVIGSGAKTYLEYFSMNLTSIIIQSNNGGGGGGSSTVTTTLSLLGLKADTSPVTADFGQIVNGKTSFTWGTSTNATITFWSAGAYSKWIAYPNVPFTLKGVHTTTNNTVFSTQTVNYQLIVPSQACDQTTGVTPLCAINGQTYTIPVTFNVLIDGQTYTATSNVSVTVSNFTTTPAAIQTYVIFGSMFAIVLGGGGYVRNKYYNEKRNKKSKYSRLQDDLGNSKTAKNLRKILSKK